MHSVVQSTGGWPCGGGVGPAPQPWRTSPHNPRGIPPSDQHTFARSSYGGGAVPVTSNWSGAPAASPADACAVPLETNVNPTPVRDAWKSAGTFVPSLNWRTYEIRRLSTSPARRLVAGLKLPTPGSAQP